MSEQQVLEPPVQEVTSKQQPGTGRKDGRNFTVASVVSRAPAPERPAEPPRLEPVPAPDQGSAGDHAPESKTAKRSRPGRLLAGVAVAALLASAGFLYWDNGRHYQATDDAFIATRQFAIAPKVSGYIAAVPVTDNEHVVAGQVLARIDDRDYRVALNQAKAQVEAAQANVQNLASQIDVQQAQVDAGQAQVDQVKATLTFAQQQAKRYEDLATTGAGSIQNAQQYTSNLHQQEAALKQAAASLAAAQGQVHTLRAQRANAEAALAQAEAQKQQADLNLSYTTVTAAQPGRVVNLSGAVGQYAAAGTNLTMFVPDEIWVDANYKETQLDQMRPGQPATIHIDAYPEHAIRGHVESVQPGSGTAFSLLPAENATGNYVKIVQRVPVKIRLDNVPTDVALGPGMSVVPTVRVDAMPSFYERLRGLK
jgi:membrane fusion protein, multidrug efflux system